MKMAILILIQDVMERPQKKYCKQASDYQAFRNWIQHEVDLQSTWLSRLC